MSQQNTPGTGLQDNVAGLLCYVAGWVTGIVFLILEPNNKFVKFHAWQSIVVFGTAFVVMFIFWLIPGTWVISTILWIAWVLLALWLIYQAYQGKKYMLPVAGNIAEKFASGQMGTPNPPANPPSNPPGNPPGTPAG